MPRFEARPGQPLQQHLAEVAEGTRQALNHPALRQCDILTKVAFIIGATHDAGKYTSFFQTYLRTQKRQDGLEYHAFPSAVLAAWLTRRAVGPFQKERPEAYLPLLAFLTVHRHHGHLKAPEALVPGHREVKAWEAGRDDVLPPTLQRFRQQWRDLHAQRERVVAELHDLGLDAGLFLEDITEATATFHDLRRQAYFLTQAKGPLSEADRARLALWGQLLFSALIDADKRSAAGMPPLPPRPTLPGNLVACYVAHRFSQPRHDLDRERAAFFQTVTRRAWKIPVPPPTPLSLTAPTGMGKTLAALSAAFVLREQLGAHYGAPPRIVYALPFINLIEQNYWVVRNVLAWGVPDFAPNEHRYLLRHHHLADIAYKTEDENRPVAEALLLTEGWESEIVVTTFVQVFHTLLGYQNGMLRKLHNLIGAVLVLDELQNLPMEYWRVTERVFRVLREEMGLTVLQMTATRPLIFREPEAEELHPDPLRLFGLMRRTEMDVDLTERPVDALADEVADLAEKHGSVLVVVNTVRTSLEMYEALKQRGVGHPVLTWEKGAPFPLSKDARALVYLSTNIVPKHRAERLAFLDHWLKAGGRAVVVATQVVEAGVDLDFPVVVRDLAPLDAIIQAAGRCNREGRRASGLVLVRRLKDSGAARVYGVVHIQQAKEMLKGICHLAEPEYAWLVERYFRQVEGLKSQATSERLWQAYLGLRYDGNNCGDVPCLSDFRLIEEMPTVPVFVALTPEDRTWLAEVFTPQVLKERDWQRRQEAYIRWRRYLHERMLQVPEFRAEKNPPPLWDDSQVLRWVPYNQFEEYYDLETGFKWKEDVLDQAWIV